MRPETLIVGAGVIGLSIARELHRRGERGIVMLDRGAAGCEASWAAAGMLTPQAEADELDLFFRFCTEARDAYPQFAAELLDETGIDIELDRTGTINLAFSDAGSAQLRKRFDWQKRCGFDVRVLSPVDIRKIEPVLAPNVRSGLLFPDDWQVENRRLVDALRKYANDNSIEIREHCAATKLVIEAGRAIGIETTRGNIECGRIILSAGAWTSLIKPPLARVIPIRGQMICFRPEKPLLRHVIFGPRGYLVPRRDGRILAGATVENAGFEDTVTAAGVESLRKMALELVPGLGNLEITETWSGLRPFSADGLPVLGGVPGIENLTVATGHFRNGILLAPITARIIAESLLEERGPEYLAAFAPGRFTGKTAGVGAE